MPIHCLLILLVLAGSALSPDSVWRALKSRYLTLKSISGSFDETICSEEQGTCQSFSGKYYVKLPDRFRIEVESPEKQLIVRGDSVVWFYFPDEQRAIRQAGLPDLHRQTGELSVPLLAFLDPMLDSSSSVSLGESTVWSDLVLNVETQDSFAAMTGLSLELDSTGTRIDVFSFHDVLGNKYQFRFSEQRWNPKLGAELFRFKPPKGTTVE